jgi:SagB-type dehydrogenase family enzyme
MVFISVSFWVFSTSISCKEKGIMQKQNQIIKLPEPKFKSSISIEEAINKRRSIRKFDDSPLEINEISQLLWAAQGINTSDGRRTVPSAGATYPLEIYLASRKINGLDKGLYKYNPQSHSLIPIKYGDIASDIANSTLQKNIIYSATAIFIITADFERTTSVYGSRGNIYVYFEVGHAAQNLSLQAVGLKIGSVMIGAFDEKELKRLLGLPINETPLYIIPCGKTKTYQ